jgi:hypothetical protein
MPLVLFVGNVMSAARTLPRPTLARPKARLRIFCEK